MLAADANNGAGAVAAGASASFPLKFRIKTAPRVLERLFAL